MDKKKILIINNPHSGRNGARRDPHEAAALFDKDKFIVDVKNTVCRSDATEIAYIYADKYDIIAACGGDGTLSEVIGGIMKSGLDVPIGYIPMGSTNDLAATVGIPTDIRSAVGVISDGHTNTYDIGSFNGRAFSYVACFGPGTHVSYSTPQKMKNLLGYSAYMINGFLFNVIPTMLEARPKHIRIEYDGNMIDDDFYFGAVSNALSVAGMFKFDRNKVRLNDGKFEIMLVRRIDGAFGLFGMLNKMIRGDFDGDSLIQLSASNIKMTFANGVDWSLDGEYGGNAHQVDINVNKQAVRIFSPQSELFI